jgi:hypothetical protein
MLSRREPQTENKVGEDEMDGTGALNTVGGDTTDASGGLDVASIRAKQAEYRAAADDKKAFYDKMEQQLLARRMGPSKREQYFQMAAALLQPTAVRGFAGSSSRSSATRARSAAPTRSRSCNWRSLPDGRILRVRNWKPKSPWLGSVRRRTRPVRRSLML